MLDWDTIFDIDDAKSDIRHFLDRWNLTGVIFISVVSFALLLTYGITSNTILAILTSVYALTSFNQMREARKATNKNPIQPDFEYDEDWELEVPVLRNFGENPALSFELLAVYDSFDGVKKIRRVEKLDEPYNLLEGDIVKIIDEEFEDFLRNNTSDEIDDDAKIRLYYAFTMLNSSRSPSGESDLLEKNLSELQEAYPNPKSINLPKLRERVMSNKKPPETEQYIS